MADEKQMDKWAERNPRQERKPGESDDDYRARLTDEELIQRVEAALPKRVTKTKLRWRHACDLWGPQSPGALGCIEHGLLPEAYGPEAHVQAMSRGDKTLWTVVYMPDPVWPRQWAFVSHSGLATKQEALVAALEAAP